MQSDEEARRAFREYMSNAATPNQNVGNHVGQPPQGQGQEQAHSYGNFMSPMNAYTAGLQAGAFGAPNPQVAFNPYAGQAVILNVQSQTHGVGAPNQFPQAQPPLPTPPSTALATSQQIAATQGGHMSAPSQPPGYVALPRSYGPPQQSQPTGAYNVGWQYNNQGSHPMNQPAAPNSYRGPWPPPDISQYPDTARNDMPMSVIVPTSIATASDPILILSHVCSVCGNMRSPGYHRHHPIVPGQPAIPTPCRKCKRKAKKKTKAEQAEKDDRTITIRIDDRRGRSRDRSERRYTRSSSSPSPRRTVVRSSSRAHLGLRVLQEARREPPQSSRRKSRVRTLYTSLSPPPEPRGRNKPPGSFPDSPTFESRVRYVESSISPPPARRTTRVEYREESLERPITDYRPRSLSPIQVPRRSYRTDDSGARISSHPTSFRNVAPGHRSYLRAADNSISTDSPTRELSPRKGILRNSTMEFETGRRRRMQDSHDSMLPEVGHNKVHFVSDGSRRGRGYIPDVDQDYRGRRSGYASEHTPNNEDFRYQRRTEREYAELPRPPSPPVHDFERLHIQHSSLSSSRDYDIDEHVRYVSPPNDRMEDRIRARTRYVSPPRDRHTRDRAHSPVLQSRSTYRGSSRSRGDKRIPEDWEDVTDSESEASRDKVEYVRYREADSTGRPYDVMEERRTRHIPGNGRGAEEAPRTFPSKPALTRSYGPM
ncbi:unnamed protein product [Periconia digitata]|uniref:Uncharacterized protein n=1 Tax=Periconia digitata TaxID=1303443 RepID=A0A9W4UCA0_9PLEO|nr:unnamed protein product [Periconia digitata]